MLTHVVGNTMFSPYWQCVHDILGCLKLDGQSFVYHLNNNSCNTYTCVLWIWTLRHHINYTEIKLTPKLILQYLLLSHKWQVFRECLTSQYYVKTPYDRYYVKSKGSILMKIGNAHGFWLFWQSEIRSSWSRFKHCSDWLVWPIGRHILSLVAQMHMTSWPKVKLDKVIVCPLFGFHLLVAPIYHFCPYLALFIYISPYLSIDIHI